MTTTYHPPQPRNIKVVLFSGGSGSAILSSELITHPQIDLTLAINGYDDGASTGEIRHFMGDMLGPSDFRKNASHLARQLQSCPSACPDLLDLRFPIPFSQPEALACLKLIQTSEALSTSAFQIYLQSLVQRLDATRREAISAKLALFTAELEHRAFPLCWDNFSLGNLVFAGCFLEANRDFNTALILYCTLLGLPTGIIENVTTGTNAYLVATDRQTGFLGSEAEIVDASRRNYIETIYLLDHALTAGEKEHLRAASREEIAHVFSRCAACLRANPDLLCKLSQADLIIYAPGTQHSSLFPSYMTPGLSAAIVRNLKAIKLLVTNIQEDAEIAGSSAVEIIEKAVYYLREKNRYPHSLPCLITHYLLNDPVRQEEEVAYVPLGRLENIEDPRLVRIANYEEGTTGHHHAKKVLQPFIEAILANRRSRKIAVFMYNADSPDKICQSLLELLRASSEHFARSLTIFYTGDTPLDPGFAALLPCEVRYVGSLAAFSDPDFLHSLVARFFAYVILFDSSGTYRGEEILNLGSLLDNARLDAIWGSRRLSPRDIRQSYKWRYRHNLLMGIISYVGSHLLSLAYLLLYGRYISDTLCGVRVLKTEYLCVHPVDLEDACANQRLLSGLLRRQAAIFETPVQFFPLHQERTRPTTVREGLRALALILWWRFRPVQKAAGESAS